MSNADGNLETELAGILAQRKLFKSFREFLKTKKCEENLYPLIYEIILEIL
jgi:hypothetical protein